MKGGETLALNERIMLSLVSTGVSHFISLCPLRIFTFQMISCPIINRFEYQFEYTYRWHITLQIHFNSLKLKIERFEEPL